MADYQMVQIPEAYFFQMATKEYNCWKTALIREFIQNSVDAEARTITITCKDGCLEIGDDGHGMSEDTILQSLLTLGGTKKRGPSVGGLGKAKEILYFSWPDWSIRTLYWQVKGKGGSYQLSKTKTKYNGTKSRIYLGETFPNPRDFIIAYLNFCHLPETRITFNKEPIPSGVMARKVDPITSIEGLGTLYENAGKTQPQVIVQAHGLYMFSTFGPVDRSYVFEITHQSYDCLTANRNGFKGKWQDQFSKMMVHVAIDSHSAKLRREQVLTVNIPEDGSQKKIPLSELIDSELGQVIADFMGINKADLDEGAVRNFMAKHYPVLEQVIDGVSLTVLQSEMRKLKTTKTLSACMNWYKAWFEEGFVIVSEEEIDSSLIRDLYSKDCLKAAVLWKMIVKEVTWAVEDLTDYSSKPGLGMIVSEDIDAKCYDGYLLFNPYSYWELSWHEAAVKMLIDAAHEYIHYLGQTVHNETFLLRFQDLLAVVLSDRLAVNDHLGRIKKVRKAG